MNYESIGRRSGRPMIVEVECPKVRRVKQARMSVKLSETLGEIRSRTPSLGQHSDGILQELGYGEDWVRQLCQAGVIG